MGYGSIFVRPFAKGHMVWGEMGIIKLYEVYEDKRRCEKPGGDRPEGPMDSRYPSWQAEPCLSETRHPICIRSLTTRAAKLRHTQKTLGGGP
jgi:hypothetical protein